MVYYMGLIGSTVGIVLWLLVGYYSVAAAYSNFVGEYSNISHGDLVDKLYGISLTIFGLLGFIMWLPTASVFTCHPRDRFYCLRHPIWSWPWYRYNPS